MVNYTSHTIIPDLKLIITNFQGTISMKDVIQLNLLFIADKSFDSSFDLLMDFRDSTALAFKIDIADFFDFFKTNVVLKKRIRSGILYSTLNQKFLISVYKPTASLMKIDTMGFQEINECLDWMQYSETDQIKIKEALQSIKNKSAE